jgi:hypothetical protein
MTLDTKFFGVTVIGIAAALIPLASDAQEKRPTQAQIVEAWLTSPHADGTSESFTHWDEDGEIPGTCAVCHSSTGVISYLNSSMQNPGIIPHSVPTGTSVGCTACHDPAAEALTIVPFPSGVSVDTFGTSAICAVCHQGRASTATVEAATQGLEDDVISGDLSFINIHYAPAAATLMGGAVQGGYEYPGKSYNGQFRHVPGLDTCVSCHQPHTLKVSIENCTICHQNADTFADIRISPTDFDGDSNTTEGIADPISTLHGQLGVAIQRYAADQTGVPIVYEINAYPYFFIDNDANGVPSKDEAKFPNRYQSWTPRLLKAAYNYQLVAKDAGIYTHNPHYALQLLYDSIDSLSARVEVDLSELTRP